ncbi:XK-related protein 4 isoform 1 [Silurus meridionalis]|nr:XK-related protein 4 isoform 1 [Silurus meridionalis]
MAAKSDGVLKMKKSDVAFTPLQNSDHSGSVPGLAAGSRPGSGSGEADFTRGEARCCGPEDSTCLRLGGERRRYGAWDGLWLVAAAAVYFADVATDVWLSVDYYLRRDYWWFGLTLFFVALGSVSVQVFSFRWFVHDFSTSESDTAAADVSSSSGNGRTNEKRSAPCSFCLWLLQSVIHIMQLGQIWRFGSCGLHPHPKVKKQLRGHHFDNISEIRRGSQKVLLGHFSLLCKGIILKAAAEHSVLKILNLAQSETMQKYPNCCESAVRVLYFHTIYLGIRSRHSSENDRWRFYWRMVYEYADVSMLHLLATFLESAPQLVLQLCIIIQTHKLQAVQGMTAAASLVSLAWALASYQKALRDSRDDKKPVSYLAVIIQFCWHFFTIAARVVTFALFASVFQLYFGIFIVLHWCIMTFWIVHCETEFCVTKWEEIVFDMVVGIIYIFSWFNVKEGHTRCRLFIYYLVILLENAALSTLWYLYRSPLGTDAFAVPALCVIFSSFFTGIVFMLMYYAFFHPNGPRFGRSASLSQLDDTNVTSGFSMATEGATNSLRSNRGGTLARDADRDAKYAERDGCAPVFQVRPTAPSTPSSRTLRVDETVIRIDVCRNRYPAWERHVLDRGIRRAILAIANSPTPPRLQYKDDMLVQERLEYETTL